MADKSIIIVGAGSGLGASLGRQFADAGYNIAMSARNSGRLEELEGDLKGRGVDAKSYGVDAADDAGMTTMFDNIETSLGPIDLALYNVNGRTVKDITELSAEDFEASWRNICLGGFIMGREAAKRMIPRKSGSIFYTGGRGARRGIAKFTAFASAKAGLRSVAECLARELSPQGIHVAHFAVEASLASERVNNAQPELAANDGLLSTDALAEVYLHTHQQPRNCWSFETDLRPWVEEFI
ncbi:MAG: SDR family NAD(P)-dependent oxidoreductase [Rhodospirillales bacterium]|nr:SDR family NAD(P)-dependent oxidoreductase [Rhodospirillales bacterium]